MTVIVKTQDEYDALPERFDEHTVVEIRAAEWIRVNKIPINSSVEAWGSSTDHHRSLVAPSLHGQAACFVHDQAIAPKVESPEATVINVKGVKDTVGWLEKDGVKQDDGKVILYKKVSNGWLTQERTSNETTWVVGEVKTHPAWNPTREECGGGKFHACSRPYFCDEFRSEPGDRYVAIQVSIADLHAWVQSPAYTHKVAFREGVVLYECDRWGDKVG